MAIQKSLRVQLPAKKIRRNCAHTDKKIFSLIYKEIQSGAVAKSYMRKGLVVFIDTCSATASVSYPAFIEEPPQ
jgi:hypothetical protein